MSLKLFQVNWQPHYNPKRSIL